MKLRSKRLVGTGDLVLPIDGREFLYTTPDKVEREEDPIDVVWDDDIPGIVIEVVAFDPPQEYHQVRIVVGDIVGWTYSDYVRIVGAYSSGQ